MEVFIANGTKAKLLFIRNLRVLCAFCGKHWLHWRSAAL